MALGATRASLRRRQTLPRESTDGWEEPESHDAVSFLTQTSLVTSHHQETSFLGEGTLLLVFFLLHLCLERDYEQSRTQMTRETTWRQIGFAGHLCLDCS